MHSYKKLRITKVNTKTNLNLIKVENKKFIILTYCFLLSTVYLLICTKTSPLYPFNDWVDPNAIFTMGKGMMNGKVLYRDLFEQKGPLLYLIHGLSYIISNKTFFGVFVFEVLFFSIFLFYSHKLILIFLDIKYTIILLPLISVTILNMKNFTHGDSAEEFCLPFLTISLYYLIDYFTNNYPNIIKNKILLLNGIIAGCVLWIKFSLLGFWFGWMATLFICMVINRQYICAIKSCFIFLLGMLIATLPWILYFGINNSIYHWLNTYLIININNYQYSSTFLERIKFILFKIIINIYFNPIFGFFFIYGLLKFIISKRFIDSFICRICLLFCILFLIFGIYGGGRGYIYYFLILSPFVIFGFISIIEIFIKKYDEKISYKIITITSFIFLIITLPITLIYNQNAYMLKINKEDLVQYKFASIINQTNNATLLNYGTLDIGLYTVTGITPNIRFYEKQNIDYSKFPLNMDEQNRYIKDKEIEYVVIRKEKLENLNIPYLTDNYKLIKTEKQLYNDIEYDYLLFKKIE